MSTAPRKQGFTLIELLVVIAIIAIRSAILFPVFQKVRENARRASCASNIKQLTLGLTQYCQDADEKFPYWNWGQSYIGATGPTATPNDGTTLWINAIYPFVKSSQVYHCPDDSHTDLRNNWGYGWFTYDTATDGHPTATGIPVELARTIISYGGNEQVFGNASALADTDSPAETFIVADSANILSGGDGYQDWKDLKAAGNPPNDPRQQERIVRIAYPNGPNSVLYKNDAAKGPFQASFDAYARHSPGNNIGYEDGHTKYLRSELTTIHLYGVTK